MEINAALNFVFPMRLLEKPDPQDATKTVVEPALWAYHTPIGEETFRQNYRIFADTKDELYRRGLQTAIAVADMTLLDCARMDAARTGLPDAGPSILAEIRRLTFVLAPSESGAGFEMVPSEVAVNRAMITKDEWHDAECALVFFTSSSLVALRSRRAERASAAASLLRGSMTSLPPMDFAASLQTLMPAAISEMEQSQVPS